MAKDSQSTTFTKKGVTRRCVVLTSSFVAVLFAAIILLLVFLLRKGSESDTVIETKTPAADSGVPESPSIKSPTGSYRYAAISTAGDPCPSIGVDILGKQQGSAVDAAIATMLCVDVVNMHSSSIGGGNFMTIYEVPNNGGDQKVMTTILARERAPLKATKDMFVFENVSSVFGGMAIGVPGEIKGFYEAWLKFGRVPWQRLLEPAIKLAKDGFFVGKSLASAISSQERYIQEYANLKEALSNSDGSLVREGEILKRPKLARTLEILQEDPDAFYNESSQLAKDVIADIQEAGGIITMQDLTGYKVYNKDPITMNISNGNYQIIAPKPPSSGVVLEYILNILDGYNFNPANISTSEGTKLVYHRIVEAFKFAFAKRSELGDEAFVPGLDSLMMNLTSATFAESIRLKIDDTRTHNISYYEPAFDILVDQGTSHCSVLAPSGSAVSMTSTHNYYFGSKIVGNRTGIVFNNEMDDFSTPGTYNIYGVPASPANYIEPGKMPMSSMSPTIVLDQNGTVRLVSGASGGPRIITSTTSVAIFTLWLGMNLTMATDVPRVHHQLSPNEIWTEPDFSEDLVQSLRMFGHTVITKSKANVQSIHNKCTERRNYVSEYLDRCIDAVVDRRKSGFPDGY